MHLHIDSLNRLWVDLEAPNENLWLISGRADQELAVLVAFVANNHGRGVLKLENLRDSLSRAGVCIEDLLDCRLLLVGVDVPNFKFASHGTDEEVIFVNLVEESRALLIVNFVTDRSEACLDVNIADEDLFVVEARDGKDS